VKAAIVDYGAGNLRSLQAAFTRAGAEPEITSDPAIVARAPLILLPGVGAARPAMEALESTGLADGLRRSLEAGGRLFGVCLGLQLLFDESAEGEVPCLGLLPGRVERLEGARRLPHMGWNDVEPVAGQPLTGPLPAACYFAHSFAVVREPDGTVLARTSTEGGAFVSLAGRGAVAGAQFHPERSGAAGQAVCQAVVDWAA
jgi:glutamine amidotransferase